MSITVEFYQFSKKINSTKQPGASDVSYQCKMLEPCSVINPRIAINMGTEFNPSNYNYAHIQSFYNRYYFINNWTFQDGLWVADMAVDALASWRDSIGQSSCYILRSSSQNDGSIIDTSYPATSQSVLSETYGTSPWSTSSDNDGLYIVGISGENTSYYAFLKSGLAAFLEYLFSDSYAGDLTENWSNTFPTLKALCNPLQYVSSIMWIPMIHTLNMTEVDVVRVGWANVYCAGWEITGSSIQNGISQWNINRHPQAGRGSYLNNAPFSNYSLFYPGFGTIPLDPECIANSSRLVAEWNLDLKTGQATLTVLCGNGNLDENTHIMSWVHSQIGVHHQVSQVINKGYGLVNAIIPALSVGANALMGNYAGAAATVAGEIGNAAASKIPSATTIGSNGGIDSLRGNPALIYEFKMVADEDNAHRGKPLCSNRTINTIPGYIKVSNAYIDIAATQTEKNSIINYMEGGFYYE